MKNSKPTEHPHSDIVPSGQETVSGGTVADTLRTFFCEQAEASPTVAAFRKVMQSVKDSNFSWEKLDPALQKSIGEHMRKMAETEPDQVRQIGAETIGSIAPLRELASRELETHPVEATKVLTRLAEARLVIEDRVTEIINKLKELKAKGGAIPHTREAILTALLTMPQMVMAQVPDEPSRGVVDGDKIVTNKYIPPGTLDWMGLMSSFVADLYLLLRVPGGRGVDPDGKKLPLKAEDRFAKFAGGLYLLDNMWAFTQNYSFELVSKILSILPGSKEGFVPTEIEIATVVLYLAIKRVRNKRLSL